MLTGQLVLHLAHEGVEGGNREWLLAAPLPTAFEALAGPAPLDLPPSESAHSYPPPF